MTLRILKLAVGTELDVIAARQRAREIAVHCNFAMQDQVRIATSVSELARNVYNYAQGGRVEFSICEVDGNQVLEIRIEDLGPGFGHLDEVLDGGYKSSTGKGLGILGAKRLMDRFDIRTALGSGTQIIMHKLLPLDCGRMTAPMVGDLGERLRARLPDSMLAEVQQQNHELLSTMAELKARQEELLQLTGELEETNRGMVALYAELDDRAANLHRADQMKSRFLSNMSHEFRTPLSSIRALAKLLLARTDGELSPEQDKQVNFILQGTVSLGDMVDDLLDLAKIEAGKVVVYPDHVDIADMFSTLRGMLRPLLVNPALALVFRAPAPGLAIYTDQGKLAQILRNFVSNAIKFTESGEILVQAVLRPGHGEIEFSVADTGLGIDADHLDMIFEEFNQIENRLQAKVKGTGLGLPLCRKLAALLNGSVHARSVLGAGSVFTAAIPLVYIAPPDAAGTSSNSKQPDSNQPI
ncbi:ATP-binding protein [Massilia sp. TSP1-1-2]|uniref:ATP-binding protein n=1 Tax=unclassified Massilia TaxID=2609279 RepID=UPI003CF278FA